VQHLTNQLADDDILLPDALNSAKKIKIHLLLFETKETSDLMMAE